jgi:hypothetical protein
MHSCIYYCRLQGVQNKALWMAERLVPLLATQVAWVRCPVPARPTFSEEKVAPPVTLRLEIVKWVKKIAVAQAKVSHILRPGNTAFKGQLKLVNGF